MPRKICYNSKLKPLAAKLRKNMTYGEIRLWRYLRSKQLLECKFVRQKPIGNYIVDFFCNKLMLVIEIDGRSHDENRYEGDCERQEKLESLGFTVMRFSEGDVLNNLEKVLFAIESWVLEQSRSKTG